MVNEACLVESASQFLPGVAALEVGMPGRMHF